MITRSKMIYGPDTSEIMRQIDRHKIGDKCVYIRDVYLTKKLPPLPKEVYTLNIESCQITECPLLPITIQYLSILFSPITELPAYLDLTQLTLHTTNITEIPFYPNLKTLSVDNSPIKKLREYPNLSNLSFSGTPFTEIPHLPKLGYLCCDASNIETIANLHVWCLKLRNIENNKHIIKPKNIYDDCVGKFTLERARESVIESMFGSKYIKRLNESEEKKRQHKLCKTIKEELLTKVWNPLNLTQNSLYER